MYLKTFEVNVLKYMNLSFFLSAPELAWKACLKKTKVELELSIKRIRGGICYAIQSFNHDCIVCNLRYAAANKKYMKNYDKDNQSPYIMHFDANNLYGWAMYQKLPFKIWWK